MNFNRYLLPTKPIYVKFDNNYRLMGQNIKQAHIRFIIFVNVKH